MNFQVKLQDVTVLIASNLHWKHIRNIWNLNMNSSFSKYFLIYKVIYLFVAIKYLFFPFNVFNKYSFLLILLYPVIIINYHMWIINPSILRPSMPPTRICILYPYSYSSYSTNMYAAHMK